MNPGTLAELRAELYRQRKALFQAVAGVEADLEAIAEDRESEQEEAAQEECDAQIYAVLDDRGKREIDEVDAALHRIGAGRYGTCTSCESPIAIARLRALPATPFCIHCARRPDDSTADRVAKEG